MSTPFVKLQRRIPNSNIVIDYWDIKVRKDLDRSIRFMTSVESLSVNAVAQIRKTNYPIYTSLFNRWYLHQFYEIPEDRILVVEYGETKEIFDADKNETIKVTAMNSHYCGGSSMFLFQGSFGNVLYTGFFRFSPSCQILDYAQLKEVVEKNMLHVAYVDNSYAAEHCEFPERLEMIINTIELIRNSSNCKIVISCKEYGREEILLAIASEFDEKIDVGPTRYSIFERLGFAHLFTCKSKETRIHVTDRLLNLNECRKKLMQDKSCVIILLTALYTYGPKRLPSKSKYPRLYIIPYSNHCNHNELKDFVRTVRPKTIIPVMKSLTYQACSVIPKSIYDLCVDADEPSSRITEDDPRIGTEEWNPVVVVPRMELQVSPLLLKRVNGSYLASPPTHPVERRSPRSPAVSRPCECSSREVTPPIPSRVCTAAATASSSSRRRKRFSSPNTLAERKKGSKKYKSKTHSPQPLPSNSNCGEPERSPQKSANASAIGKMRSSIHSDTTVLATSSSDEGLPSANTSAVERSSESVVESVPSPSLIAPPGDENEQCGVCSPTNLEGVRDSSGVTLRETESEVPLGNKPDVMNIPRLEDPNPTTASSPDGCLIREGCNVPLNLVSLTASQIEDMPLTLRLQNADLRSIPEDCRRLEDPNPTTASSPDGCLIREGCNVPLNLASLTASQIEDMPLTLRLQNADLRSIPEDCRNVLLGSTFPLLYHDEERIEEMPPTPDLANEDTCFDDFTIEECSVEVTSDVCPSDETNFSPSENSIEKAVEADSADSSMLVDDAGETAPLCDVISDTSGIRSSTPTEVAGCSSNSKNLSPSFKGFLDTVIPSESSENQLSPSTEKDVTSASVTVNTNRQDSISNIQADFEERNSSLDDDVTLFEPEESFSSSANVADLASKNLAAIEASSKPDSEEEDSCILVETSHPVNNSSHLSVRASPDDRRSGNKDADQSDSDDCVVVDEYRLETTKLETMRQRNRNKKFVFAILYHCMKLHPPETTDLSTNQTEFLCKGNIFDHPAYRRS